MVILKLITTMCLVALSASVALAQSEGDTLLTEPLEVPEQLEEEGDTGWDILLEKILNTGVIVFVIVLFVLIWGIALYYLRKQHRTIGTSQKDAELNPNGKLVEQTEPEGPLDKFKSVIKRNPKSAQALNDLGFELERQGKVKEAIAKYRKAIQVDANFTPA